MLSILTIRYYYIYYYIPLYTALCKKVEILKSLLLGDCIRRRRVNTPFFLAPTIKFFLVSKMETEKTFKRIEKKGFSFFIGSLSKLALQIAKTNGAFTLLRRMEKIRRHSLLRISHRKRNDSYIRDMTHI
jgi:c-di-GMP-related signal transduction protein